MLLIIRDIHYIKKSVNNSEIKNKLHIGILAATPEEVGAILSKINHISKISFGELAIFSGIWNENNLKILLFI